MPIDFCCHSAAIVTSVVYHAIRQAPTYQTVVYQLTAMPCWSAEKQSYCFECSFWYPLYALTAEFNPTLLHSVGK